ncbi:hypothetical protein N657DRAFT_636174 [Parathielavia appendiculata]|uniref:Heterokaryon incompatibility domain-containing protein n=1 Tax=Parathielavia appendiculata TaxID=2587402 RepID=A0AAN6Z1P5_9PEZI|nr:hypothetical protein N657DRAFT_636174 [Parathielavia appendiculata]
MQDAVAVCGALSVCYLWMDTLCIIQDLADLSNWERESEQIGQVFQNAYFPICTVPMTNCHQNFLDRRQHAFDFDIQSSLHPLARSAFTLLYTGLPDDHWDLDSPAIDLQNSLMFVRDNAARKLSSKSDRLLALSGIARHVSDLTRDKYLVGLRKEGLYSALLWYPSKARQSLAERLAPLRTSSGSGAPPWSWVSQPGRCFDYGADLAPREYHLRPEYRDTDGWTALKGAGLNPFGEVESGRIRLRSKMLTIPTDLEMLYTWRRKQDGKADDSDEYGELEDEDEDEKYAENADEVSKRGMGMGVRGLQPR